MKNIDIKNNISDQDASKHKDFGKVLDKFNALKIPFYKSPYFLGGGIVSALLVTFLVINSKNTSPETTYRNDSYLAEYKSPINEEISYEFIDVVIGQDPAIVTTKNGTKITIPSNTLVDSLGELITGKVTLKFRDILDQKDIFMSGIPMIYDSAGTKFNFESGGMFEVLAYQNNLPVYIGVNKSVQVDLASEQVGDNFNLYYYSPTKNNWEYLGKDEFGFSKEEVLAVNEVLLNITDTLVDLDAEKMELVETLDKLKTQKPIKPKVLDKEKYSFNINVDYKDFPELKAFKGLKFQVSDKEKNFNPDYAKQVWEGVAIESGTERNDYNTCFSKQKQNICFITNPVVDEQNIKFANEIYDNIYDEYLAIKDSLKERKKIIRKALAKQSEELAERRIIELNKRNAEMAYEMENKVTRIFQIAQFGIWNSDCPQKLPSEAIVKAKFVDENGVELKFARIYLVLKDRNEVITIPNSDLEKGLRYNPKEECMIWGVTNDNKSVGYIQTNQFKAINKAKSFTFKMEIVESNEFASYSTQEIFNL